MSAAVELEIFAMLVTIIEDIVRLQPLRQFRIEAEARFDIAIVVRRDFQRREAILLKGRGGGKISPVVKARC